MQSRRTFIQIIPVAGAALLTTREALASRPSDAMDPKAAQAVALKYVEKTANPAQRCDNCQLYQGKASDAWAPCPLVPGKKVAGPGSCGVWVKKS